MKNKKFDKTYINNNKAVVLTRVSHISQSDDGLSLQAQDKRTAEYCAKRNLTVIKKFEIIESSTIGDREQYQSVIKFIEDQNETIALIVDKVDRLQRSFKESVILDEMRRAGKVELHFYGEGLVITKDSQTRDIMMWDFAVMGAKSYVLTLSENVKRSVDYKLKSGEWIGKAPIGYLNAKDEFDKRTVILDKVRAPFIKKAFELYSTGEYSFEKLAEYFSDKLVNNNKSLKPLSPSQFHLVIKNPFYAGRMLVKGKLYPHKYERLISESLFEKCQQVRTGNVKKKLYTDQNQQSFED